MMISQGCPLNNLIWEPRKRRVVVLLSGAGIEQEARALLVSLEIILGRLVALTAMALLPRLLLQFSRTSLSAQGNNS